MRYLFVFGESAQNLLYVDVRKTHTCRSVETVPSETVLMYVLGS